MLMNNELSSRYEWHINRSMTTSPLELSGITLSIPWGAWSTSIDKKKKKKDGK